MLAGRVTEASMACSQGSLGSRQADRRSAPTADLSMPAPAPRASASWSASYSCCRDWRSCTRVGGDRGSEFAGNPRGLLPHNHPDVAFAAARSGVQAGSRRVI